MAFVPTQISEGLTELSGNVSDVFSNVGEIAQTVNSVYDQLTGQSESIPSEAAQMPPAKPIVEPGSWTTQSSVLPSGVPSGPVLAIGAVVVVALVIILVK